MIRHWTLHEALIYGHGVERPFLCPVHGDSRPSASVNTVKNVWVCYSCGAHGGLTGEDALIEPDFEVMATWFADKMEEHRVYPESWLARWSAGADLSYWTDRVGEEAVSHFNLGFDPERDAATYPFRDRSGAVLGVVRRSLGGDGPKYLYPKGLDVGQYLFNYSPAPRRVVVLVEGAVDAIALWNVGVHAFAIYGARLSEAQVHLIDRVDPEWVVTAFDQDDAGWGAHLEVQRAFKHRYVDRLTWPRGRGKDVAELGPELLSKYASHLVCDDLTCIESPTCRSRASAPKKPLLIRCSRRTSTPRRLRIVPTPI